MIQVDADDPRPPYEQIRAALAAEITSGRLPAGQRLPTVRQIAGDLRVAVGTAARAYRELEEAGHVETRRSKGTTVRSGQVVAVDLGATTAAFIRDVRRGDVTLGEVLAAVEATWASA